MISNKIKIPIKYLTLVRSGRLFGGDTDLGEESTVLDAGYDVVRNTNRPPKLIINYTDYINDKKATTIQKRVRGNISRDESARWGYLTKEIKERKWSDIEKSLLKEGFDKESINQFKKNYYLGKSSKKRRSTKRRKRRSTKRRSTKRRSTKRRSTKRRSTKRRSTKRRSTKRV